MFVTVNYCYHFVFEIVTNENILQSLVIFPVKVSITGLLDTGHELNVHKYPKPSVCTFNLRLVCRGGLVVQFFPICDSVITKLIVKSTIVKTVLGKLPPVLILTLILNQTLTLIRGQFSSGAIFRTL